MKLTLYQVDAFASKVFEGNPAAVCPLAHWLDDELLQKIAQENNLSETAFFVASGSQFQLRWFTPNAEVDLCGHATLAAAHVIYRHFAYDGAQLNFQTNSGQLMVTKTPEGYSMDFPASMPHAKPPSVNLLAGLGEITPKKVLAAQDYIVELNSEAQVRALKPDLARWLKLDLRGVVITAAAEQGDFVSRCFYPKLNVNEDPVTGSAHCQLAPYWGTKLNKTHLRGHQLSQRGGSVDCHLMGKRVILSGNAVDYLVGEITI